MQPSVEKYKISNKVNKQSIIITLQWKHSRHRITIHKTSRSNTFGYAIRNLISTISCFLALWSWKRYERDNKIHREQYNYPQLTACSYWLASIMNINITKILDRYLIAARPIVEPAACSVGHRRPSVDCKFVAPKKSWDAWRPLTSFKAKVGVQNQTDVFI